MKRIKEIISKVSDRLLPGEGHSGGMELVQVAILVAIAIALGLIFRTKITAFVNKTFEGLNGGF